MTLRGREDVRLHIGALGSPKKTKTRARQERKQGASAGLRELRQNVALLIVITSRSVDV